MKIVIIGASFAGISAAIASRKKYPQAEISLIDKQATVGYLSCLLYTSPSPRD